MDNKGNKHIKVTVRYIGNPEPFNKDWLETDGVRKVKEEALNKFKINSDSNSYCLQYEDVILDEVWTLGQAGLIPGNDRYMIELIVREDQDTDGGELNCM